MGPYSIRCFSALRPEINGAVRIYSRISSPTRSVSVFTKWKSSIATAVTHTLSPCKSNAGAVPFSGVRGLESS